MSLLKKIVYLQIKQENIFWKLLNFKKQNNWYLYKTQISNWNMIKPSKTLLQLFLQPKPMSFEKFFLRKGYHQFSYYVEKIINYYTGLIYFFYPFINLKKFL